MRKLLTIAALAAFAACSSQSDTDVGEVSPENDQGEAQTDETQGQRPADQTQTGRTGWDTTNQTGWDTTNQTGRTGWDSAAPDTTRPAWPTETGTDTSGMWHDSL